jgi:hypothetical protein
LQAYVNSQILNDYLLNRAELILCVVNQNAVPLKLLQIRKLIDFCLALVAPEYKLLQGYFGQVSRNVEVAIKYQSLLFFSNEIDLCLADILKKLEQLILQNKFLVVLEFQIYL